MSREQRCKRRLRMGNALVVLQRIESDHKRVMPIFPVHRRFLTSKSRQFAAPFVHSSLPLSPKVF